MKSIKILLPAALTFAMFMGVNTTHAQSSYNGSSGQPLNSTILDLMPKKAIGLEYTQSLIEINNALTYGVKSDHTVDFQGKVMVHIAVDAKGQVQNVSFNKDLSPKLINAIETALKAQPITPVSLNGKAKAQTFKIPVRIK